MNLKFVYIVILFAVLAFGVGFYIWDDLSAVSPVSEDKSAKISIENKSEGKAIIEQVPVNNKKSITNSAIKSLSEELKIKPDFLNGWLQLGLLKKAVGDYQGAKESWEYAVTVWPDEYVAYNNLADLYHFYLKDFSKAELNAKKVIELNPNLAAGYRSLFELYTLSYKEKMDLAGDVLIDGIKNNPGADA